MADGGEYCGDVSVDAVTQQLQQLRVAAQFGNFRDQCLLDRGGHLGHSLVQLADDCRRRPSDDRGVVMARFHHGQTLVLQVSPIERFAARSLPSPLCLREAKNSPRLDRPATSCPGDWLSDSYGQRDTESQSSNSVLLRGESESPMSSHPSAIAIEFNTLQRETLTAIVDTFVASVPSENDPDGFYAAKGSDVGADLATEQYLLTHLPEEQLAGLLQLIDGAGLFGFKDQPQAVREEILANFAAISPEAAGAIAALNQLSVLFAYCSSRTGWPQPAVGRHGVSRARPRTHRRTPARPWRSSPSPVRRRSMRMSSWSAPAAAAEWPPQRSRRPASG